MAEQKEQDTFQNAKNAVWALADDHDLTDSEIMHNLGRIREIAQIEIERMLDGA